MQELDFDGNYLPDMLDPPRIPKYVLRLDNTSWWKRIANRLFVAWLRRCFNYEGYEMQARGRHSDRTQAFVDHDHMPNSHRDVPVGFAEHIAIYIRRRKVFSRIIEMEGVSVRMEWRESIQMPDL